MANALSLHGADAAVGAIVEAHGGVAVIACPSSITSTARWIGAVAVPIAIGGTMREGAITAGPSRETVANTWSFANSLVAAEMGTDGLITKRPLPSTGALAHAGGNA